jgi:predicted TIM-barrel fold metal-dependent hydrolase
VIIDSLAFLEEGLLDALDAAGIERAIVCPTRARGVGHNIGNDRVTAAVALHPDRLIGFARLDPLLPRAAAELDRARGLG